MSERKGHTLAHHGPCPFRIRSIVSAQTVELMDLDCRQPFKDPVPVDEIILRPGPYVRSVPV